MTVETYQKRLERHLSQYRKERLGLLAESTGTFTHKGVTRSYGHILPLELKWLNVPEPFRQEIHKYVDGKAGPEPRKLKLHQFFHHLNSSQAFALALFFPYLSKSPAALAKALGVSSIAEWEFEAIPDPGEETNVDLWWQASNKRVTYCEVKLSEREFGSAVDDVRHQKKLTETYAPVLGGQVDAALLEPKRFFRDYQILRNLWLAARPGHETAQVLFVLPKANTGPNEQLEAALKLTRAALRSRVRVVHVEPLLETLAADRAPGGLAWYARMLCEKYLPE